MPGNSITDDAPDEHDRSYVKRRLVANTGASIVANVWAIVISILVVPLLISGLGLEAFGIWALLQAFSGITGWFSLADLGVGVASTRALAGAEATDDVRLRAVLVSTTVWYFVGVGLISTALYAVAGSAIVETSSFEPSNPDNVLSVVVLLAALQVGVDLSSRSFVSILEGFQRVDLARLVDGIRRTLVAVFAAIAAVSVGTLQAAVGAALVGSCLGALASTVVGLRVAGCGARSPSWSITVGLLRSGISIGLLRPLGVIQRTMDRIIVGVIIGPVAVGSVEIAASLQNGADAVLSASSNSVTPSASYLQASGDSTGVRRLLVRGTRYSLLTTGPAAVFVVLCSASIIDIWIGEAAPDESAALAQLAGLTVLITALAAVSSNLLVGVGLARTVLLAATLSIFINLGLSIVLANSMGPEGVFIATLIAATILVPSLILPALRFTTAPLREFLTQAAIPGLVPSVILACVLGAINAVTDDSWLRLILGVTVGGAAVATSTVRYGLERHELDRILARVRRKPR